MATQQNKGIGFRYRINENWAKNNNSREVEVEGIKLTTEWKVFSSKQYKLEKQIRSIFNPQAIVDLEEFSLDTGEIFFSSNPSYYENIKLPFFKKEDLEIMKRDELGFIARLMRIDPIRKTNDFLIKLILQKQKELKNINSDIFIKNQGEK